MSKFKEKMFKLIEEFFEFRDRMGIPNLFKDEKCPYCRSYNCLGACDGR